MKTAASVQARLGSTRLPGKVLLHLGERRILGWVLTRAEAATNINQTIVAVGDRHENKAIIEYCDREEIQTIVGPEENLLARHLAVAEQTDCDLFVRITADCPFVSPAEIDRVVKAHRENGARYTTNNTDAMPIGTAVDVLEPGLLADLDEHGETHPVKRPRAAPNDWGTVRDDNPAWHEFGDVHMAVDTPDDYWSLTDAVEAVGEDPQSVAKWLSQ
jgi:spore coat polysaccharide biosynthesis protein SpsF